LVPFSRADATMRSSLTPSASRRTTKGSAVVAIGVEWLSVGCDNGLTRAVPRKGSFRELRIYGVLGVLKAKLYYIGVICSDVSTL
jgi:hypothetical protein